MKKQPIILVGGGGHCKSAIDVIEAENKFQIMGILDKKDKAGNKILGYKIIGTDELLNKLISRCQNYLVTIGHISSAKLRIELYNRIKALGGSLPNIVSPHSYLSKYAEIGEGNIIMHHSTINADVHIGNNCIINSKALIEHDCKIGNHVHISTNSTLNGNCHVGDGSFLGSGCTIIQGINIASEVIIGAGCILTKDIPPKSTVIGNPGRIL